MTTETPSSSSTTSAPHHGVIARIIEGSAHHRGLVLLACAVALAAGVVAMKSLKLDAIPDLTETQVIVFTEWMGRSPTLVEDQVTYPIVSQLVSAPKVTDVRGFSMFGMSFVYVVFQEGTDVYWARSRVNEYLGSLRQKLPVGAEPTLGPDATGIGWVFQYVLTDKSGQHGLDELRTFQDFTLRYALAAVPGVAEVASVGGYEKQYQIVIDPQRLKAHGLTLDDVTRAVRDSNADVGGRSIEMSGREYYVRGRGYLANVDDIEKIALHAEGGTAVRVGDVAHVRIGPELRRGVLDWDGEGEAVGAIVVMRTGENAVDVIDRVKARLEELRPGFPAGVTVDVAYDRSSLIQRSISTLKGALFEELIVVSLVILLFLLHFRSSLLAIVAIPASVLLAFIPMAVMGIPSTIMSLGGIAIAIGATVDAVIVMIEACHKKLEHAPPGAARRELLLEAAREVTPAIFFSLLIIAVAFLPVFALQGQAGKLFQPLALTKTFVMVASALLSITLAPALLDLLVRGRIYKESEHPISRAIIRLYQPFVYVAMKRPRSTVAIGIFAIISAVPMGLRLGHEFMPALDEGDVLYMPITFPNISIEEAKRQLQRQDQVIKSFAEVDSVFGKIGRAETATDPAPLTMVETTVRLKPIANWPLVDGKRRTMTELTAAMNAAMQFPGWTNAWTMPIKTRIDMMTTGVRTPVGVKVFGQKIEDIEATGIALERVLAHVPGTRTVLYERGLGGLYVDVVPDRDAIGRYGLTVGDVERMVETAIGGAPLTTTIEGRARFTVSVRYPQDIRGDPDALKALLVPVRSGAGSAAAMTSMTPAPNATPSSAAPLFLPLADLADVRIVAGPPMVRDEDGMLVGYVYVDIDDDHDVGGYVGEAKKAVAAALADGDLVLPASQFLKWTGQYEQFEQMAARMKVLVPLTLLLVVVLLFLQFRSARQVFLILLSIPFALVGSVWLLTALDYRLSTAVWVGVIALAGLAAQTGIVMLVYIRHAVDARQRNGLLRTFDDVVAAHMEGTVQRVRPKLMTVSTMLVGLVPLLWASGSGADVMKRIAAPMVGGLLTSAFLTLEIIPVLSVHLTWEALLWARAEPSLRRRLQIATIVGAIGLLLPAGVASAGLYVDVERTALIAASVAGAVVVIIALILYRAARRRLMIAPTS